MENRCLDEETLTAYVFGGLELDDALRAAQHVESCEVCARQAAELAQLLTDMSQGTRADPGAEFWEQFADQIMTRVEQEAAASAAPPPAREVAAPERAASHAPAPALAASSALRARPVSHPTAPTPGRWGQRARRWVGAGLAAAGLLTWVVVSSSPEPSPEPVAVAPQAPSVKVDPADAELEAALQVLAAAGPDDELAEEAPLPDEVAQALTGESLGEVTRLLGDEAQAPTAEDDVALEDLDPAALGTLLDGLNQMVRG